MGPSEIVSRDKSKTGDSVVVSVFLLPPNAFPMTIDPEIRICSRPSGLKAAGYRAEIGPMYSRATTMLSNRTRLTWPSGALVM